MRAHAEAKPAKVPFTTSSSFSQASSGLLQRKCACGGAAGMTGACEECSKKKRLGLQTKLEVSEPGDIYEQEADRISEQIIRMPEPQRACPCGGGCPKCQTEQPGQEHARVQPKRLDAGDSGHVHVPPIAQKAVSSPGQPLDAASRAFFEPRFGYNFGNVRVHNSEQAARSARDQQARAYTVGRHIVFGAGEHSTHSTQGRLLLAHELTHVVQQNSARASVAGSPISITAASSEARVMREPVKVNAMTPAELMKYILDQRGFHSTAPRVTTDAAGTLVLKRGSIIPAIEPLGIGKLLGLGFETHAIVQVFDAKGNLVASELGVFSGSYQTHAPRGVHAEAQGVSALRARLSGVDVSGGRMVAAVDQSVCSNCASELHSLAESLRLKGYEVYGPGRESLSQPGTSVSPKTAARTAYMGGTRPAVAPELIAGASFIPNRGALQGTTEPFTAPEPLAPTAPLARTVSGEITVPGKTVPEPTSTTPPAKTVISQNVVPGAATQPVPSVSGVVSPTRPGIKMRLGRLGVGTLRIGGGIIKGSLWSAAILLPLSFLSGREQQRKMEAELKRLEEDELSGKLEEALMPVIGSLPRSNLFSHIKIKLEFRKEDWGGIAPDIRYFFERAYLESVDVTLGKPAKIPEPDCGSKEVCYLNLYTPVPLAMADMPADFQKVLNHVASLLMDVSKDISVAGERFDEVNKNLYIALRMLGKTWETDWTTTAVMKDAERFTTLKSAVEKSLPAMSNALGTKPAEDETQLLAKLWLAKYQLDALDSLWPMKIAEWDD